MVGEQADGGKAEVGQDLRADAGFVNGALFPARRMLALAQTGFVQIDQHSGAFLGDALERRFEGRLAIAFGGVENVARDSAGVHSHQNIFPPRDIPSHQGQVLFAVDGADKSDGLEVAPSGAQAAFGAAFEEMPVCAVPVADQAGDRNHQHSVLFAEFQELRHARHGAVFIHDFADDAAGFQAGQAREVDGGLGLPRPDENSAFPRAQGENVTGTGEIARAAVGTDGGANGLRAVGRGDSRADSFGRVDGFAESGAETRRCSWAKPAAGAGRRNVRAREGGR